MRRRTYLAGTSSVVGFGILTGRSRGEPTGTNGPKFHLWGDGLGVSISSTNAPVKAGERLEVIYSVGSGAEPTRDVVRLLVGDEIVAAETWDLEAQATVTDALQYPTFRVQQDVTVEITLQTAIDEDTTTVTVQADE